MKRQQEWLLTQWKVGNSPNVDKTCKYNLNLTSYCHQLSVITASTNSQIPNNSKRNKEVELDRNNSRHQTHFFKIKPTAISIITLFSSKQIQFLQHHLPRFFIHFFATDTVDIDMSSIFIWFFCSLESEEIRKRRNFMIQ